MSTLYLTHNVSSSTLVCSTLRPLKESSFSCIEVFFFLVFQIFLRFENIVVIYGLFFFKNSLISGYVQVSSKWILLTEHLLFTNGNILSFNWEIPLWKIFHSLKVNKFYHKIIFYTFLLFLLHPRLTSQLSQWNFNLQGFNLSLSLYLAFPSFLPVINWCFVC